MKGLQIAAGVTCTKSILRKAVQQLASLVLARLYACVLSQSDLVSILIGTAQDPNSGKHPSAAGFRVESLALRINAWGLVVGLGPSPHRKLHTAKPKSDYECASRSSNGFPAADLP